MKSVVALGLALLVGGGAIGPGRAAAAASGPAVSVLDVGGLKKSIKRKKGRAVLLHFWATWCLPCLDELPIVSRFAQEMKPRGLEVLSVSLDPPAKQDAVGRMLREKAPNLTPTIVRVDDVTSFLSSVDADWEGAIPAMFAFDQSGELRGRLIGESSRQQMDDLVGYMLKPAKR